MGARPLIGLMNATRVEVEILSELGNVAYHTRMECYEISILRINRPCNVQCHSLCSSVSGADNLVLRR